jgi:hypothetical protein
MEFTTPPPAHSPMAIDSTATLGSLTGSTFYSQGTDAEMRDMDWTSDSEDEMSPDTPCLPSIETDDMDETEDGTSLRGGVLPPPPNHALVRKLAVHSWRNEWYGDEWNRDGDEIEIEYPDLPEVPEDPEDDGNSTSSDWDGYGDLPRTMDQYEASVAQLEGSEDWNEDQRKLHKLIYMRGLHPMMPSWWRVSFKMWGVTQPHLDDVFTPKHSKKRVVIHAYGNEVAGKRPSVSIRLLSG